MSSEQAVKVGRSLGYLGGVGVDSVGKVRDLVYGGKESWMWFYRVTLGVILMC